MKPRRRAALAALAAAPLLMTTACSPGWQGDGTIVELELLDYDHEGHNLTETEGLEVTVITDTGSEAAVQVRPDCMNNLQLGQVINQDRLVAQCGDIEFSSDD